MTKPFFKRGGDTTIYYNYSEWLSRSCNFRKLLGKPRFFLQLVQEFGRRGSRYILSEQEGRKKKESGEEKETRKRQKKEREGKRGTEMRSKRSDKSGDGEEGGGGGKINAPSGIARKASI